MNTQKVIFSSLAMILLFAFALTFVPPAHASPSFVQSKTGTATVAGNGAAHTVTVTPTSNPTVGNVVVIYVGFQGVQNNPTMTSGCSVTDSSSNTWTAADNGLQRAETEYNAGIPDYQTAGGCLFYSTITTGGSDTITGHWSSVGDGTGTSINIDVTYLEWSGLPSVVVAKTTTASGSGGGNVNIHTASFSFGSNAVILAEFAECGAVNTYTSGFTSIGGGLSVEGVEYATSGITSPTTFSINANISSAGNCAGGSMNWVETGISLTSGNITLNLTCILKETGATTETWTASGAGVSPTSGSCTTGSGTNTALSASPSSTVTITVQTDGANTRYRFNASATSSTTQQISTPSSGSKSVTIWNYYQLQNTYAMNPSSPSTWDATYTEHPTGTVTGVGSTNICAITLTSGMGSANCAGWADYNLAVSLPASFASSLSGTWTATNTHSFTDTTGGNTHTTNYTLGSVSFTLKCILQESGATTETWTASGASVSPTSGSCTTGSGTSTVLTVSPASTLTITVQTDATNTRYRFNSSATSPTTQQFTTQASGTATKTIWNYYQLQNTWSDKMKGSQTGAKFAATFTITYSGTAAGLTSQTICTNSIVSGVTGTISCSGWSDYSATVSFSPHKVFLVPPNKQIAVASPWTFAPTTGGNTYDPEWFLQWFNQFTVTEVNHALDTNTFVITGTVNGTASSTICTVSTTSGDTTDSCKGWSDDGSVDSFPNPNAGAVANTRWDSGATTTFTITSGGGTFSVAYYFQLQNTYECNPVAPTVWDGIYTCSAVGTLLGVAHTTVGTASTTNGGGAVSYTVWVDWDVQVTLPNLFVNSHGFDWLPNTYQFTSTTGGNTLIAGYTLGGLTITITVSSTTTTTITGFNTPDAQNLTNVLEALVVPLLVADALSYLLILLGRRGDFHVTLFLFGLALGATILMLGDIKGNLANGTAPLAFAIIAWIEFAVWVYQGGQGDGAYASGDVGDGGDFSFD